MGHPVEETIKHEVVNDPLNCEIKDEFKNHISTGHDHEESAIQMHKCHICNKEFDQYGLEEHILTFHVLENNSTENKCEKELGIKKEVLENVFEGGASEKHEEDITKIHECNLCDKTFYTPSELKTHIKNVHEKLKNHKCHLCDKAFSQPLTLRIHMSRIHKTRIKKHKCDLCEKTFSQSSNLNSHIESVHKGQ